MSIRKKGIGAAVLAAVSIGTLGAIAAPAANASTVTRTCASGFTFQALPTGGYGCWGIVDYKAPTSTTKTYGQWTSSNTYNEDGSGNLYCWGNARGHISGWNPGAYDITGSDLIGYPTSEDGKRNERDPRCVYTGGTYKTKDAIPDGYSLLGGSWVKWGTGTVTETEDYSAEAAAINAAMSATTYADASAKLASAQAGFDSLYLSSSKAALQSSLDAAVAKVATLQTEASEAQKKSVAQAAINSVMSATTYAAASAKMAEANTAYSALNATNKAALKSSLDAATAKVAALQAAELAEADETQKKTLAENAIAAVMSATTYAAASAKMDEANAAYAALNADNKAALKASLDAASARVAGLKPSNGGSSNGGSSNGGSSNGGSSNGGSSNGGASIAEKIAELVTEIDTISAGGNANIGRVVIAASEMNALVKENAALVDPALKGAVEEANSKVAGILGVDDATAGDIQVTSVLVGKGDSAKSDKNHFTAITKSLADTKNIVLVSISADKDWSKAKRATYIAKVKKAAMAAGVSADRIKVAKPRPVETVAVYSNVM